MMNAGSELFLMDVDICFKSSLYCGRHGLTETTAVHHSGEEVADDDDDDRDGRTIV